MMKSKIAIVVMVLVFGFSSTVIAEEEEAWWGSWYSQGNVSFSIRAAFESHSRFGGGVGAYPGVELAPVASAD